MKHSDIITDLAKALAKAQAQLKNPSYDSCADTGKYKYRYASLAAVRDAVSPVLSEHGLAVSQSPGTTDKGPFVVTFLLHSSGQWLETDPLMIPVAKPDAQGYGSAITYARRYALMALLNIVGDDDDDAQVAIQQPARQQPVAQSPQPAATNGQQKPMSVYERATRFENNLVAEGLCQSGELIDYLVKTLSRSIPGPIREWPAKAMDAVGDECKAFYSKCKVAASRNIMEHNTDGG